MLMTTPLALGGRGACSFQAQLLTVCQRERQQRDTDAQRPCLVEQLRVSLVRLRCIENRVRTTDNDEKARKSRRVAEPASVRRAKSSAAPPLVLFVAGADARSNRSRRCFSCFVLWCFVVLCGVLFSWAEETRQSDKKAHLCDGQLRALRGVAL